MFSLVLKYTVQDVLTVFKEQLKEKKSTMDSTKFWTCLVRKLLLCYTRADCIQTEASRLKTDFYDLLMCERNVKSALCEDYLLLLKETFSSEVTVNIQSDTEVDDALASHQSKGQMSSHHIEANQTEMLFREPDFVVTTDEEESNEETTCEWESNNVMKDKKKLHNAQQEKTLKIQFCDNDLTNRASEHSKVKNLNCNSSPTDSNAGGRNLFGSPTFRYSDFYKMYFAKSAGQAELENLKTYFAGVSTKPVEHKPSRSRIVLKPVVVSLKSPCRQSSHLLAKNSNKKRFRVSDDEEPSDHDYTANKMLCKLPPKIENTSDTEQEPSYNKLLPFKDCVPEVTHVDMGQKVISVNRDNVNSSSENAFQFCANESMKKAVEREEFSVTQTLPPLWKKLMLVLSEDQFSEVIANGKLLENWSQALHKISNTDCVVKFNDVTFGKKCNPYFKACGKCLNTDCGFKYIFMMPSEPDFSKCSEAKMYVSWSCEHSFNKDIFEACKPKKS